MESLVFFVLMLVAAYYVGFIGMAWYLGFYRDKFKSETEHNINMFLIFCLCLTAMCYFGIN